jgi:hypothetical protein
MRTLSSSLGLVLLALVAAAAFAREVPPEPRLNFATSAPAPGPVTTTGVRADTLFLFAASGPGAWGMPGTNARGYTFDNGAGGPAEAGWTPYDATSNNATYWHLQSLTLSNGHATDFSAVDDFANGGPTAGNDYAWWCGREEACGWTHPTGYGTLWEQWLVLSVPAAATAGLLEFDYIADFEGDGYDYFTLYAKAGGDEPVELLSNHVSGEQLVRHYGPIAFGNVDELIFEFHSDGGWSDEDGSFVTDIGAVWLDNFEIDYTGAPDVAWDFESGIEADFPALEATFAPGAGMYGALYANLFAEDQCIVNSTYAWAFFDLSTTNPEYPIPVTPYGPPYFDNGIQSPLLERAHALGDPVGLSVDDAYDGNSQFLLRYMVYRDLPLNALVFYAAFVSAQTEESPCLGQWATHNVYYYGEDGWGDWFIDFTLHLNNSAAGGNVTGIGIRHMVVDQCAVWCNVNGDGSGHTPAPYFDMISGMLVNSSSIAWNIDVFRRFQDNFPEPSGKVRIDSSIDVQPTHGTTLVIGDSTRIDLNMNGEGGILADLASVPGQTRPSLYLYSRVVAGPHAGSTDQALGDPDASDGIWSPHIGTAVVNGETWNIAIADTARYQGTAYGGVWAFDFADDYFEPGDILEFYYKATSNLGTVSTRPLWAESADPALRSTYIVRCLPTAGVAMLFCDDANGMLPWWEEAFRYNGYEDYDVYATQAPSSGLHNGLGGRAEIGDLDQYEVIVWDSGDLPSYTIQNALPDDIAFDDVLLDDWLTNSAHNTCLWVMGNELATDQADEPSFLNEDLGAVRILYGTYYDDLTGILVPTVYATHPALEIGGLDPYFTLDAGCPTVENLDLVTLNGTNPLAVEAFAWADAGGSQAKAGIYNQDPDGNGNASSPGGYTNRTLFNPFSYYEVWDAGFGIADGYDYARRLVGDVLANLCGYEANTAPDGVEPVPAHFALAGGYPNPFNPKTTIRFALAAPERVHLVVYDLAGRRVRTLVNAALPAAEHEAVWDGTDDAGARVASGVYFARLVAGEFIASEKLVLVK